MIGVRFRSGLPHYGLPEVLQLLTLHLYNKLEEPPRVGWAGDLRPPARHTALHSARFGVMSGQIVLSAQVFNQPQRRDVFLFCSIAQAFPHFFRRVTA